MRDALAESGFGATLLEREEGTCGKWLFVRRCWSGEMHAECGMHLRKVAFDDAAGARRMRHGECQMRLRKVALCDAAVEREQCIEATMALVYKWLLMAPMALMSTNRKNV